jgi:ABC-type antimicrobial peptide transport system permease subunit
MGMRRAAIGGVAGFLAALHPVRFMRSMLLEIRVYDPRIVLAAAAVLSTAVLLACAVPALKATKVNPTIALRSE